MSFEETQLPEVKWKGSLTGEARFVEKPFSMGAISTGGQIQIRDLRPIAHTHRKQRLPDFLR